jgi:RNA polymerase sigma factor for flagellar operon FliA
MKAQSTVPFDILQQPTLSPEPAGGLSAGQRARNQRIEQYLPLVGKVLAKLRRNLPLHVDLDDLHSAGITGLIAAAERFDPAQIGSFQGYVCLRIRGAILDELRRLDTSSRRSRVRHREIQVAVQEIEQERGRAPTDAEVSERLHISVEELVRRREAAAPSRLISLDGGCDGTGEHGQSLHDVIVDQNHACVREMMEKKETVRLLSEHLATLPDLPKRVLALYYFEGLRFSEIAEVFCLSEARICQIHKQTVTKLGASIRRSGG